MMPSVITVCGIEYPVQLVDAGEIDDKLGQFKTTPLSIKIRKDASFDIHMSTLLHEIIEAVNWQFEVELTHKQISILGTALCLELA